MEPRSESEVLVVGAGPVGMLAASFLAKNGVRTQIVDQGSRPTSRSYALALHPASLGLFAQLDLARSLVARGEILDTVAFYDDHARRAEVRFAELETDFPFVLVVAQSVLEEVLDAYLREHDVAVHWRYRSTAFRPAEGGVDVVLEKLMTESTGYGLIRNLPTLYDPRPSHAQWVIGADGYRSAVRRSLDVDYRDVGPSQIFGVFELESPWDEGHEVRVVLGEGTMGVLWPLGKGRFRWSFELTEAERSSPRLKRRLLVQMGEEAFPYIAQELLEDLIRERAPWFDAPIRDVTWSVAVRFDRRLVSHFGRDRMWLAGDSAHLACPVGVHSMNIGLAEAADLARRLVDVLRHGAAPEGLEDYDRQWLGCWEGLLERDCGAAAQAAGGWVQQNAARLVASIPASGGELRQLAAQLDIKL